MLVSALIPKLQPSNSRVRTPPPRTTRAHPPDHQSARLRRSQIKKIGFLQVGAMEVFRRDELPGVSRASRCGNRNIDSLPRCNGVSLVSRYLHVLQFLPVRVLSVLTPHKTTVVACCCYCCSPSTMTALLQLVCWKHEQQQQ